MNNMWWNEYYDEISEEELLDQFGLNDSEDLISCEDIYSYDLKHVAWLEAKPEYEEVLAADGYDVVELADNNGNLELVTTTSDDIYPVEEEVKRLLENADSDFDTVETFCNYFDIGYPEEVVDFEDYHVPRWHGQRAVSYFGYDQLVDMTEEIRDGMGIDCEIAGNGDLYIFE